MKILCNVLSCFVMIAILMYTMPAFIPGVNAALCPYDHMGTVISKDTENNTITIQMDYIYDGTGPEWSPCNCTLEGMPPNENALNELNVGDYVQAHSLGAPGGMWVTLARLISSAENFKVITDIYGDPKSMIHYHPILGDYKITYVNTPNCSSCYGCNCEAEYTTVTIINSGNVSTLLYPNQSYVHQGETYHIDITFHSGAASADPECTEEICFGPQSTSDFTFEFYRAGGKGEISAKITAGADDGFVARTPEVFRADSTGITIGTDLKFAAFLRFSDLKIPSNATITKAYISVVPAVTNPTGPMVHISAADVANPTAPTTSSEFYARTRTTSSVNWDASSWAAGESENSTDISSVIQELVDSYDYFAGAPIMIFLDIAGEGTENQYFAAFENAEYEAPKLYVEYSTGESTGGG